jgi:hypothetical protein
MEQITKIIDSLYSMLFTITIGFLLLMASYQLYNGQCTESIACSALGIAICVFRMSE